ncbi:uncharacterized protein [Oryza sativa Japonica Group]|uniref:uncharacterized protein n=1 Tax=Oryza sativa subsp. japonica TaxID=39947 RepID=UPI00339C0FC6
MDRTWIHGRQFTPAYMEGVKQFMEFVGQRFDEHVDIPCPCCRCLNHTSLPQQEMHDHIHIFGMSSTYTRWIYHGELVDTEDVEYLEQVHETNHNEGTDVGGYEPEDDNGVPELIGELYTAAEEDGQPPRFARILEDAKQALCPGSNHSRFSFLVRLLHIKSYYRINNTAFTELLKLLSSAFPQCQLPKSYDEAKKYLRELGLGYVSIHVCKNNCVLFLKEYANMDLCPICGESRWEDGVGDRKVPRKVLRHFPLIPRLKRIFASKRTAEDTQWHKIKRKPVDNEMSHAADGEAWKDFDRKYRTFAEDARNMRLAIATDGFNPFGKVSNSYSMWPVLVMPLNLPPWESVDPSNCIMSLLIPGPTSPGKDFDLFLEPLIEELLELWIGVSTYDAFSARKFNLRAAVLWCIHDYPALSTLSGRTTKGYYACIHCDKNPLSRALRNKIGYFGHRRFLPRTHAWRRSHAFDGHHENQVEPGKFSTDEVLEQLEKVKDVRPGKHDTSKKRKRGENEGPLIYSRKVSLWKLPYWKDLLLPHNLDVMHFEKNICDNILGTLLKIEGKTKDTVNSRIDLHDMNKRHNLHLQQDGNSVRIPQARYVLKKEQRIDPGCSFCQYFECVMQLPVFHVSNFIANVQSLLQSSMKAIMEEPVPDGETPRTSAEVVSKVLSRDNSNTTFLKNAGLQMSSKKSVTPTEAALQEELAAEKQSLAILHAEVVELKEQANLANEALAKTQKELAEFKQQQEENNLLLRRILSLSQGNLNLS